MQYVSLHVISQMDFIWIKHVVLSIPGGGSISVDVSLSAGVTQEGCYFRAISLCCGPQWPSDTSLQSKGKCLNLEKAPKMFYKINNNLHSCH